MTLSSNTPYSYSFNAAAEVSVPDVLSVTEDEGTVQVCATLNTLFIAEFDITVTLATSDGTGMCLQQLILLMYYLFLQLQMVLTTWECPWTWSSLLVPAMVLCSV